MKKRIAVLAALVLANLTGCASVAEADGMVLPFVAVGILSFEPGKLSEPRAARVNAQVAQLLNQQDRQLVAAR